MSGTDGVDGFSRDRAELFEALGHPTRVRILRLLADSPRSFSELKGALGIDSSGQLQFHLGKLNGLIRVGEQGNYALTDEGKEALRITTVEPSRTEEQLKRLRRRLKTFAIVVLVLVAAGASAYYAYSHAYSDYAIAAKSLQVSGFRITNFTVVDWNSTDGQIVFTCEVEYTVMNPSDYSFELQFHQIYQGFETQQFGWSLTLVQPVPCTVQPNSTTIFRAVSGDYSSISGNIYPGCISFPLDDGTYICSYLNNITGRYRILGSMGYDMGGEADLSSGIFHAKLLFNWGSWEDA
jgi:DNA-binding transcriptional ArsR family regulator